VAVVPVVVGTGVAVAESGAIWWRSLLALVVSLSIQVGTNYANDYSDGVRGTDARRVGPVRLVASGLASPGSVRAAALFSFGVAAVAGLVLALVTSPWLIAVGLGCLLAGWLYTGGPKPYGYIGLGELFVFVFFGLVAVVGTAYVSTMKLSSLGFVASVPVGLLAVALLVVNNLRDLPNDALAGKKTLAVRLGDRRTRLLYEACLVGTFLGVGGVAAYRPLASLALAGVVLAALPFKKVRDGAAGPELIEALSLSSRLGLVIGVLLALGIAA
jgi:1,4-dihydroxy-2-naphthoate octaprenyltransferase